MQPSDFGAPTALGTFRPQQAEVFEKLLYSGRRVDVAALPTGVGKSLLAWTYARATQARAVILTASRALQDQYMRDFAPVGLVDVRGMSNYPCVLERETACADGPCMDGLTCPVKDRCPYFAAVARAVAAPIVVTNYDFWFAHPEGLGKRDLLILDEAHAVRDNIASAAGAHFNARDLKLPEGSFVDAPLDAWRAWAQAQRTLAGETLARESLKGSERRLVRSLWERLSRVAIIPDEALADWAVDYVPGKFLSIEPILPQRYTESVLLRGIPKVLLMSATIRPQDLDDLGVEADDRHFWETGSPFPPENRPVYRIELGFNMNYYTSETNLLYQVAVIDNLIHRRRDRKGIIHSVSYKRAQFLKQHSRFGDMMLAPADWEAREAVESFKRDPRPRILVSPSVETGVDFPYDLAEYQVIAKVPYPNTLSGIAAARQAADKDYGTKIAVARLVQMAGRIVRAADDSGETFIVDDSVNHLMRRYRTLFPAWFRAAYREASAVDAPKKFRGGLDKMPVEADDVQ